MMNHTSLQKQGFRARAQDVLLNGKPRKEKHPKTKSYAFIGEEDEINQRLVFYNI